MACEEYNHHSSHTHHPIHAKHVDVCTCSILSLSVLATYTIVRVKNMHVYMYLFLCHRMNCVSFDTIGVAGFGHEFGSLEGRQSDVKDMFEVFGSSPPKGLSIILPLLGPVLPLLQMIPNERESINKRLNKALAAISSVLLQKSRKEKEMGETELGRTIMGTLGESKNIQPRNICSLNLYLR